MVLYWTKPAGPQNLGDFVHLLIKYEANVNLVNQTRKQAPLHFAVKSSDLKTLQCLLDSPNIDVNILDDTGCTALHLACKAGKLEQVKALLGHPHVVVNAVNRKDETPIHLAVKKKNAHIILELLKHKDTDIDSVQTKSGQTIRECIEEEFPNLVPHLPEPKVIYADYIEESDVVSKLFTYLRVNDLDSFTKLIKTDSNWVNSDDGRQTLLQYACEHGLFDFVNLLVRYGADINYICNNDGKTGLILACSQGYYEIVKLLLGTHSVSLAPTKDETILHTVVKNCDSLGATGDGQDYRKCLKVILNAALDKLDINQGDDKGNTALHYAAKTGKRDIIFSLLDHGAYIGARNALGEPSLAVMCPKILEAYLDRCISTNKKLPSEGNYEIIFKYNFLVLPTTCERSTSDFIDIECNGKSGAPVSETDPLLYMSQSSELRPLLTHPILTSYIYLKWYSVRRFFYFNLAFYVLFCLFQTMYILFCYDSSESITDKGNNGSHSSPSPKSKFIAGSLLWNFTRYTLIGLLGVLVFRELFQLRTSPIQYARTLENWLEIPLIIVTVTILCDELSKKLRNQISAVGILLSWVDLFLLMGKLPSLSTKAEMFKTVSKNFFKFLSFYSILILAFALSFYSLFKDSPVTKNSEPKEMPVGVNPRLNNSDTFSNPGKSIFKTVVMLTGEFESASIPFEISPVISHVLFILFVFLVAIVLFNLLNGLAVSDTQEIRTEAKLVGYVSRVKFISFMERMVLGIPIPFRGFAEYIRSVHCCVPDRLLARNFPDSVRVLPNQENRVDLVPTGHRRKRQYLETDDKSISCFASCDTSMLKGSIVRAARDVLLKRLEEADKSDTVEVKKRLDEYGRRLKQLETMAQQSQDIMNKMFAMIEKIHRGCSSS